VGACLLIAWAVVLLLCRRSGRWSLRSLRRALYGLWFGKPAPDGGPGAAASVAQLCGLDDEDAHAVLWVVQGRAPLADVELAPCISQVAALYASLVPTDAEARQLRLRWLRTVACAAALPLLPPLGAALLLPQGPDLVPEFVGVWAGMLAALGVRSASGVESRESRLRRLQHYSGLQQACFSVVTGQPVAG
jgi:hypothetical protein